MTTIKEWLQEQEDMTDEEIKELDRKASHDAAVEQDVREGKY